MINAQGIVGRVLRQQSCVLISDEVEERRELLTFFLFSQISPRDLVRSWARGTQLIAKKHASPPALVRLPAGFLL